MYPPPPGICGVGRFPDARTTRIICTLIFVFFKGRPPPIPRSRRCVRCMVVAYRFARACVVCGVCVCAWCVVCVYNVVCVGVIVRACVCVRLFRYDVCVGCIYVNGVGTWQNMGGGHIPKFWVWKWGGAQTYLCPPLWKVGGGTCPPCPPGSYASVGVCFFVFFWFNSLFCTNNRMT